MSTAALMLVKDEVDIIEHTLRHLMEEVDYIVLADNGSTDGTFEIASELLLREDAGHPHGYGDVRIDEDPAYYQSKKTTAMASWALAHGFQWAVPCDADEYWYATDGRRIREFLAGLAPDVGFVRAELYNHLPTGQDDVAVCESCDNVGWYIEADRRTGEPEQVQCQVGEPNPFRRIGWRQREHGALAKVACRLRPELEIHMGNHSAWAPGSSVTTSGLVVRHFSWRSPQQYLHKIRVGEAAFAATDLPEDVGAHWRMWEGKPDEAVTDHFRTWFYIPDPLSPDRDDLIYDPAPVFDRSEEETQ